MRFYRVMKLGHNLADILAFGLLAEIMRRGIQIMYNHGTKERLDRCFRGL